MKSEHRHELKTNELAQWLSNLPQWSKDNLGSILIVTVVIIAFVGFYGWRFYTKNVVESGEHIQFTNMVRDVMNTRADIVSQNIQSQGSDVSYVLLRQADDLGKFAETTENKNIAALGLVKEADAIRGELHYRNEMISAITPEYLEQQINKAKSIYSKAIEKSPSDKNIKALAALGLGLCEEELGNFDQARQIYNNILEEADFQGTVSVVKAQRRLNTMDDYKQEIEFQPQPEPEVLEASSPAVELIPSDANQPADANAPLEISISDVNSSANIDLPLEVNIPVGSVLPTEVNIPDQVNIPANVNEPIE